MPAEASRIVVNKRQPFMSLTLTLNFHKHTPLTKHDMFTGGGGGVYCRQLQTLPRTQSRPSPRSPKHRISTQETLGQDK